MRHVSILLLAVAAVATLPEAAHACAVCFDANDESRQAFIATTAFLTLLPLGMVTGAGLWLRRRVRERDEREASPDSARGGSPLG